MLKVLFVVAVVVEFFDVANFAGVEPVTFEESLNADGVGGWTVVVVFVPFVESEGLVVCERKGVDDKLL